MHKKCRPIASRKMIVWRNEITRQQKDAIIELAIKPGATSKQIADKLADEGVIRKSIARITVSRMYKKLQHAGLVTFDHNKEVWNPTSELDS